MSWSTHVEGFSVSWSTHVEGFSVSWSTHVEGLSVSWSTHVEGLSVSWSTHVEGLSVSWSTHVEGLSVSWSTHTKETFSVLVHSFKRDSQCPGPLTQKDFQCPGPLIQATLSVSRTRGTFNVRVHSFISSFHLGFVHPLLDVALHQCLPLSSICCFPNPGGSLLLCFVHLLSFNLAI